MRLQDITPNLTLTDLEPDIVVTVLAVNRTSDDALQIFYHPLGSSGPQSKILLREHEPSLAIATEKHPWPFVGISAKCIGAVEAKRIDLAHLFVPMMAVYAFDMESLPPIIRPYMSRYSGASRCGCWPRPRHWQDDHDLYLHVRAAVADRFTTSPGGSLRQPDRTVVRGAAAKLGFNFHVYSRELAPTVPTDDPNSEVHVSEEISVGLVSAGVEDSLKRTVAEIVGSLGF